MQLVQDLDGAQSILPFFDYTNTDLSRKRLQKLFSDVPATLAGVLERQETIKAFLANWPHLEHYNYQNIDFREAHAYSTQLLQQDPHEPQRLLGKQFTLLFQEKEVRQKKSKVVQLILLFDHLYSRFFSRLSKDSFPSSFQPALHSFNTFIKQAEVQRFSNFIKQNTFSNAQALEYEVKLQHLAPGLLTAAWEFLFLFEAYFSVAKGIQKQGFVFPQFQEGVFNLKDFYHPLLKAPVKNSISLTKSENVVLLTGPNMSGKSTLLKSISICVYLARLGMAVPAAACTLPFYAALSININSKDNLESGYSHFMNELLSLKTAVKIAQAGKACFVVFDEIFKGTNADDAQALLLETVQGLGSLKGSLFFISTHFLNLKEHQQIQTPHVKKYHIPCALLDGKPVFTYQLAEGWTDVKIGKVLFEQVGLSALLKK
ncbi:MutS-related protein [Rufibacter ruber]|uniref:MutS-related protein n=1 Tax=Rufibacter ruber TaxID=1783499 RepID=UPI000831EA72|nr:hypothetical protein [Rufibacter ruber]